MYSGIVGVTLAHSVKNRAFRFLETPSKERLRLLSNIDNKIGRSAIGSYGDFLRYPNIFGRM